MDVNNSEVDGELETLSLKDHQIKQLIDENYKLKVDNENLIKEANKLTRIATKMHTELKK